MNAQEIAPQYMSPTSDNRWIGAFCTRTQSRESSGSGRPRSARASAADLICCLNGRSEAGESARIAFFGSCSCRPPPVRAGETWIAAGYSSVHKECACDKLTVAIRKAVSGKKDVSASHAIRSRISRKHRRSARIGSVHTGSASIRLGRCGHIRSTSSATVGFLSAIRYVICVTAQLNASTSFLTMCDNAQSIAHGW